jgi:hypothetical protein
MTYPWRGALNRVTISKTDKRLFTSQSAHKTCTAHTTSSTSCPETKSRRHPRLFAWAVAGSLLTVVMLMNGCGPSSKKFVGYQQWLGGNAATYGAKGSGPQGHPSSYTAHPNQAPILSNAGAEFDRPATSGGSSSNWEDQKVRIAALEMARSIPSTQKVKICYDAKHDEWWVTFYDRQGAMYDLKQFVWERESEKLEPFLVQQRISQTKLEDHVKREEKGRACEAFDPPHGTM